MLDYVATDYTKMVSGYDLILELCVSGRCSPGGWLLPAAATWWSAAPCQRSCRPPPSGGSYRREAGRSGSSGCGPTEDLLGVASMAATGSLRAVIERTYPLNGVPEALRQLGEGRALGKLVIEVG